MLWNKRGIAVAPPRAAHGMGSFEPQQRRFGRRSPFHGNTRCRSGSPVARRAPLSEEVAAPEDGRPGEVCWLTFTQFAASGMGCYIAGRLRTRWVLIHGDETYFRDTAHRFLGLGGCSDQHCCDAQLRSRCHRKQRRDVGVSRHSRHSRRSSVNGGYSGAVSMRRRRS